MAVEWTFLAPLLTCSSFIQLECFYEANQVTRKSKGTAEGRELGFEPAAPSVGKSSIPTALPLVKEGGLSRRGVVQRGEAVVVRWTRITSTNFLSVS